MDDATFAREQIECNAAAAYKLLYDSWPRPIPVGERLPEINDTVMWWEDGSWIFGALKQFANDVDDGPHQWKAGDFYVDPFDEMSCLQLKHGHITHWLPLPPAPPA